MRLALALAGALTTSPALAIDWTQPIKDESGASIANCPDSKTPDCGKVLTVGDAAVFALFANFPDERALSGEDKYKRAILAMKIRGSEKDFVPSAEDLAQIKTLVGKAYGGLVVLRVWQAIDPSLK